ncbi:MAG: PorP/SprF family type IX secretion system membrane protein [Bacteroidales bacterium]
MSKWLLYILTFFLSFCGFFSEAQDIHFTQYYTSPENLNPALTGFFNGTQRFTLQNKTQWRSVTTPFKTLSASYDMPVRKRYFKQDIFGGGIVFNRDQAGDSKFGTTQANISLSYIRSISRINNQFVSFGIQAGAAQRTIDYSKLVFDSQYDGTSFNPALSNNEQFSKENFIFFDLSAGAYWHYIRHKGLYYNGGIALFHINKPKQSLFGNNDIRLDRKFVMHGNSQFEVTKKILVLPGFLFMQQGTCNEIDIGALGKFIIEPAEANYLALQFGMYYRFKDALNFIAGLDYKNISVGINYDVNTSNLVPASHSRGGFEISLIYIMNNNTKTYVKKVPCPIF